MRWQIHEGTPAPELKDNVLLYVGYEEAVPRAVRRLEVGEPVARIILGLDSGFTVHSLDARNSFRAQSLFVSPGVAAVIVDHPGRMRCIEIPLSVRAAAKIGGPPAAWPRQVANLRDVCPKFRLDDALAEIPSWAERFRELDRVFRDEGLAGAGKDSHGLHWAWNQIRNQHGRAKIGQVAAALGFSRKHFVARYREATGVTPKAQARRWRLSEALRLVTGTSLPLADVAIRCCYSDQSHMNREFRELAGCTPAGCRDMRFADLPGIPAAVVDGR